MEILEKVAYMKGLAEGLGLTALPAGYFAALAGIVAGYILLESLAKKLYLRRYHSWL